MRIASSVSKKSPLRQIETMFDQESTIDSAVPIKTNMPGEIDGAPACMAGRAWPGEVGSAIVSVMSGPGGVGGACRLCGRLTFAR